MSFGRGYSKPSVSRAMGVLKDAGYITHSHYGDITLTAAGREKARRILKSHHLITDFFVRVLKLDHDAAEEDACRIEHVISDTALDAIESYLDKQ